MDESGCEFERRISHDSYEKFGMGFAWEWIVGLILNYNAPLFLLHHLVLVHAERITTRYDAKSKGNNDLPIHYINTRCFDSKQASNDGMKRVRFKALCIKICSSFLSCYSNLQRFPFSSFHHTTRRPISIFP